MRFLFIFCFCLNFSSFAQTTPADSTTLVRIKAIHLQGNERTKAYIILRELDLHEGDTLRKYQLKERLELDRRKIFNLNLFVKVDANFTELPDNEVDVFFSIKENWYIIPNIVFLLADRNFNEWWNQRNHDFSRVVYGIRLQHNNFRGRNEKIRIIYENGFAQRVELAYRIPYIDKAQRIGIGASVGYSTTNNVSYTSTRDQLIEYKSENTIRSRFGASLGGSYRESFYNFHYGTLSYSSTTIADSVAMLNPNYFGNGQTRMRFLQLYYGFVHDFRDNVNYPTKGNYFEIGATQTGIFNDDVSHFSAFVNYAKFWDLGKRLFASVSLEQKFSIPTKQPYVLLRGLGYGSDMVRGYESYVVDGQHYSLLKSNFKWQILDTRFNAKFMPAKQFNLIPLSIYLNTYFDMGYVNNNLYAESTKSNLSNSLLMGAGVGVDVISFYNLLLRFNYGINKRGEYGFVFTSFRDF
jgi:outer membrane protein assembly factor BamA